MKFPGFLRIAQVAVLFTVSVSCGSSEFGVKSLSGSLALVDRGNISVFDLNSGKIEQLTESPGTDGFPSWSPDGNSIAFESDRDGDLEIYVMNADGSDVRQLTYDDHADGYPTFSSDGNTIAFQSNRYGAPQIFVVSSSGSEELSVSTKGIRGETLTWKQ